jgi:methyl-accepting chemotaxis protein
MHLLRRLDPTATLKRLLLVPVLVLAALLALQGLLGKLALDRVASSYGPLVARLQLADDARADLQSLRLEAYRFVGCKTPQGQEPIAAAIVQGGLALTGRFQQLGLATTDYDTLAGHYAQALDLQRAFKQSKAYDLLNGPSLEAHSRVEATLIEVARQAATDIGLAEQRATRARISALITTVILILGTLALSAGMLWIAHRRALRPMAGISAALERIGRGDLSAHLPDQGVAELRSTAQALNHMVELLAGTRQGITARAGELAVQAEHLHDNSLSAATAAQDTSRQALSASAAAKQVVGNVGEVAAAALTMGGSAQEIARATAEAREATEQARTLVTEADAAMARLADAGEEIGQVLELISQVAERTNLLSLNAAIEAAGAGESGRGFAVVAGEVKTLAGQTQTATGDIAKRIAAIQSGVQEASSGMQAVAGIIGRLSDLQAHVTKAVEEQSATTGAIARSVALADAGVKEIGNSIGAVAHTAESSSSMAQELRSSSQGVARLADGLVDLART